MQSKTTRAFRTISEAGEELDLQPHVLRFWESKFPQIKPMKRGGGRRFYRPEDIEFLRGIKILLHDEKHPIKDVQKLIRVKGPGRVMELGRSVERAANPKPIEDTVLIPERIAQSEPDPIPTTQDAPQQTQSGPETAPEPTYTPQAAAPRSDILRPIGGGSVAPPPPVAAPPATPPPAAPAMTPPQAPQAAPPQEAPAPERAAEPAGLSDTDREDLTSALERLQKLRGRWDSFKKDSD